MKDLKKIIEKIAEGTSSIKFAELKDMVSDIEINNDTLEEVHTIISILIGDKRKNVTSLANKLMKNCEKFINEYDRVMNLYLFDKDMVNKHNGKVLAGVDEVGRGPLAGPIVSAAVVLDLDSLDKIILGINDSKKVPLLKREELSKIIMDNCLDYCIASFDNREIDEQGIGVCNNNVFLNAVHGLTKVKPDIVLSDGYPIKGIDIINEAVIKGDTKSASIACASIIAKVYRDNIMKEYDKKYPQYDFKENVGYGTSKHVEAIKEYGSCDIHRMSFLKNILK